MQGDSSIGSILDIEQIKARWGKPYSMAHLADLSGDCMIWHGPYSNETPGRMAYPQTTLPMRRIHNLQERQAARFFYRIAYPEDPIRGWSLSPRCSDRRCVNPVHYFKNVQNTVFSTNPE